jgi:hypothetical protein
MKAQKQGLRPQTQETQHKAYLPKLIGNICTVYFYGGILFFITLMLGKAFGEPFNPALGKPSIFFGLPLWLGIAFTLSCLCVGMILWYCGHIVRLANRHIPVYEITEGSVINRIDFLTRAVVVRKDNIESLMIKTVGIQPVIAVILKDKEAFYKSLTRHQRFWAHLNEWSAGTPFLLWQLWSSIPLADLQKEIQNKN